MRLPGDGVADRLGELGLARPDVAGEHHQRWAPQHRIEQLFFGNLSERTGKMLREDIEMLGPVKLRDVDEVQASIVAMAKDLAAQGLIEISEGKNDDEMIV